MARAGCFSASLSGAAPVLQTCRLGRGLACHVPAVSRGRSPDNCFSRNWGPSFGYRLAVTGPHECVKARAKKKRGGEGHAGEKGRGGEEKRECISNGKMKWFYNSNLPSRTQRAGCILNGEIKWFYQFYFPICSRREKCAGCGQVRSQKKIGYVPIAVRQGRQRRDAVAAG